MGKKCYICTKLIYYFKKRRFKMEQEKIETITINDVEYVRKDTNQQATKFDGMEYCMVRTYSAGVFAGYVESRDGQEIVLRKARRIWYWDGAASLSQLATDGTSNPGNCKFPCEVDKVVLLQVIEIIPITEKAKKSIDAVPIWEK
jgi:hypothetical protein